MKAVYSGSPSYVSVVVGSDKMSNIYALFHVIIKDGFKSDYCFHNFSLTPSMFRYYSELLVGLSVGQLLDRIDSKEEYFDNETFELF